MSDAIEKLRRLEQWIRNPEGKNFTLASDIFDEAADEIERLRAENDRLREALECLIDEQNGPPLLGHERSWCIAMDMARAALGEEREK